MLSPDYQQVVLNDAGRIIGASERMAHKLEAVTLPDLAGASLLDVGCDGGFWCWTAAERGARDVLGLDRNRPVKGVGHVDLIAQNRAVAAQHGLPCRFERINLGKQWHEFGGFDVALCLSMYHHVFENSGDHAPIWYWLWRHVTPDGLLIWEGPTDTTDAVVRMNVTASGYEFEAIVAAARAFFDVAPPTPARHEPTRVVLRMRPRRLPALRQTAEVRSGPTGGASEAFRYAGERRINEIQRILGMRPIPGSLNLSVDEFDWDWGYYRARLLDAVDRLTGPNGFEGTWAARWCRFYPLTMNGVRAWAMRFEGDTYPPEFVELIADVRLMDHVQGNKVTLAR